MEETGRDPAGHIGLRPVASIHTGRRIQVPEEQMHYLAREAQTARGLDIAGHRQTEVAARRPRQRTR